MKLCRPLHLLGGRLAWLVHDHWWWIPRTTTAKRKQMRKSPVNLQASLLGYHHVCYGMLFKQTHTRMRFTQSTRPTSAVIRCFKSTN